MNKLILIHSAHLPLEIVLVVTIEPLKEVEEANEKFVLVVIEYEVLNTMFI